MIPKNIPKDAKSTYDGAFKGALRYYAGDEDKASKVAWSAVKKDYKKDPKSGDWEKRANAQSWKYDSVSIRTLIKEAKIDPEILKEALTGTVGESDDLSKEAEWDGDLKMSIYKIVKSASTQGLRKLAQTDHLLNKIMLDNYHNSMLQ